MAAEKMKFQKVSCIPTINFQVRTVSFLECKGAKSEKWDVERRDSLPQVYQLISPTKTFSFLSIPNKDGKKGLFPYEKRF